MFLGDKHMMNRINMLTRAVKSNKAKETKTPPKSAETPGRDVHLIDRWSSQSAAQEHPADGRSTQMVDFVIGVSPSPFCRVLNMLCNSLTEICEGKSSQHLNIRESFKTTIVLNFCSICWKSLSFLQLGK